LTPPRPDLDHPDEEQAVNIHTETVLVNASPEAIYDYVSDFARHPEWAHNPLDIKAGDESQGQPVATFEYVTHFMGSAAGEGVVVETERPNRFTYECEDKNGKYRWTFDLKPESDATRLSHTVVRLRAPLYIKVMQALLYPFVGRKMIQGGLDNIKVKLEAA
jgi:uncharacterized protein YndB with AHSA1/START domain